MTGTHSNSNSDRSEALPAEKVGDLTAHQYDDTR